MDDANLLVNALQMIASSYYWLNKINESIDYKKQAIEIAKKFNLDHYLYELYYTLGESYIKQNKFNKAIVQLNKAESLLLKKSNQNDIEQLRKQINYEPRIIQAQSYCYKKLNMNKLLLENADKYKALTTKNESGMISDAMPSIKKIQNSLKENQAVIAFTNLNTDQLFDSAEISEMQNPIIIYIDKNIVKSKFSKPKEEIEKMQQYIDRFYNRNLSDNDRENLIEEYSAYYYKDKNQLDSLKKNIKSNADTEKYLKYFYQAFINPIENFINDDINTLTLIPDGYLFELPFETFTNEDGEYLIENYNINYCNSFSLLMEDNFKSNNSETKILAIGNPNYDDEVKKIKFNTKFALDRSINKKLLDGESIADEMSALIKFKWAPLPGTQTEIDLIKKMFNLTKTLTKKKATEKNLMEMSQSSELLDYNIIHFACHGFYNDDRPALSSLILSIDRETTNQQEGFLTLAEISQLKLNADLINLSACETSKGENYTIEGIDGFIQAFFNAGAKSVLSTLWNIEDQSAQIFMAEFYKNFKESNDYTQALNQTKKNFINGNFGEEYKHPKFWSPYTYFIKN